MSSKTIEIEEKTIDNAIAKACRDFGVPREKLNIEIISEGSGGFLGLMAKKARIRASLLALDMDFSMDTDNPQARPQANREPRREARPETRREERPEARHEDRSGSRRDNKPQTQQSPKPVQTKPMEKRSASAPVKPDAPRHASTARKTDVFQETPREKPVRPVSAVIGAPATTPAALQAAELLSGILTRMSFDCRVSATETDDTIFLAIEGDESGLLIGRRGQNLDALQYVINKAVNRSESDRKMIVVDSEDYRRRREESLLDMAQRIRDKVIKTQKPLSLGHMNAHDRRIIHLALQEDEALITKSRGEGEYRKIIVLPARKGSGGSNSRAVRSRP
ncbi:MAG: RNA-binding cell elongation regulator Jag/EloR [Smithellaceae bacterium]